jgi:hypothetical protein
MSMVMTPLNLSAVFAALLPSGFASVRLIFASHATKLLEVQNLSYAREWVSVH